MTTNIILTELEKKAILAINNSEYSSYGIGSEVWSFTICDNSDITKKQVSGVVSSLVKKGLAGSNGDAGNDATVWLTKLGIEVAIENDLCGQYK